jgi:RNA polymerase sigma factor (sigma-70 family)
MRPNPWPLIRRLARRPVGESDPVSDAELLARFVRAGDQTAFELLVWRHGPMVLGACRRILRDVHLAEDAFQAAFLILARKAGSVRSACVAGWLHRVARRVAVRAARPRKRIEPLTADPLDRPAPDAELRAVLDAEIDRLPERFRLPVVLCYLNGRTTEDAARLLGIPRGTVLSRLATARQRLAARLTRRGITAPAALAAIAGTGSEVVSTESVAACVTAAIRFACGAAVPGGTVQLAEGVLHMGFRKATALKQSAEIQRLTAELHANRELAQQLTRMILALELEQKGLPAPDAPRASGADDKLDRVLRELADLRAEVRRLSEKK